MDAAQGLQHPVGYGSHRLGHPIRHAARQEHEGKKGAQAQDVLLPGHRDRALVARCQAEGLVRQRIPNGCQQIWAQDSWLSTTVLHYPPPVSNLNDEFSQKY